VDGGSVERLATAILILAVAALAERGWMWLRWTPYFAAGLPLFQDPLPLGRMPEGEAGIVGGLRWERLASGDGARWWADPDQRRFPRGLHGIVWFGKVGRSVALAVRWSPPWTPILAMAWLAFVGAVDGQGWLTGPLAAVLVFALVAAHHRHAERAGALLRYGWAKEQDVP
jgi:hypothetical protein